MHHHYLKGSIVCGGCGSRLIVNLAKNRHGALYRYFVCSGRHEKRNDCQQRAVLIDAVEQKIEDHYRTVQPSAELLEHLQTFVIEALDEFRATSIMEKEQLGQRVDELQRKQRKLLEAHYADAIPLDLFTSEQTAIAAELNRAEGKLASFDGDDEIVTANLSRAFDLAGNWHQAYLEAPDKIRRAMNQAIFTSIEVDEFGEITIRFTEPFGILLGQERPDTSDKAIGQAAGGVATSWFEVLLESEYNNPRCYDAVGGWRMDLLVGAEGLEPPDIFLARAPNSSECGISVGWTPAGTNLPRLPHTASWMPPGRREAAIELVSAQDVDQLPLTPGTTQPIV